MGRNRRDAVVTQEQGLRQRREINIVCCLAFANALEGSACQHTIASYQGGHNSFPIKGNIGHIRTVRFAEPDATFIQMKICIITNTIIITIRRATVWFFTIASVQLPPVCTIQIKLQPPEKQNRKRQRTWNLRKDTGAREETQAVHSAWRARQYAGAGSWGQTLANPET
jgi:hypothetical protein